jgi:hypothetical protein
MLHFLCLILYLLPLLILCIENENKQCLQEDNKPPAWFEKFEMRFENFEMRFENFEMKYERQRKEDRVDLFNLIKGRHHNRQSEVAETLNACSVSVHRTNKNGTVVDYATGHHIFFKEKFFMLSVVHFGEVREDDFLCPKMDVIGSSAVIPASA